MPEEPTISQEFEAVRTIVSTLEPLDHDGRQRVLLFALQRLGISELTAPRVNLNPPVQPSQSEANLTARKARPGFHKSLLELTKEKSPKSGTQMAAVIAYYLMELAPQDQRKETVGTDDVVKYSRKAKFRLPKSVKDILIHAEGTGYFEHVGDGQYRLTKQGYDLVDTKLPPKKR